MSDDEACYDPFCKWCKAFDPTLLQANSAFLESVNKNVTSSVSASQQSNKNKRSADTAFSNDDVNDESSTSFWERGEKRMLTNNTRFWRVHYEKEEAKLSLRSRMSIQKEGYMKFFKEVKKSVGP